ncbi:MAG: universal stress protein [Bacteroidota bacterium]
MKNILVPIGINESVVNTLQYAIDFAKHVDAEIYLVDIFNIPRFSASYVKVGNLYEKESREHLKVAIKDVDTKGVKIHSTSLVSYKTFDSIKNFCDVYKIDLIISSTKNNLSDTSIFLGEITGCMVKDSTVPVLIIPSEAFYKPIKKVLIAIKSGKIKLDTTLIPLAKIKEKYDSVIDLIQVKTPQMETKDLDLNTNLKEMVSKSTLTENATVFQGVLEFLHEEDPDLICVIRRKRGFFKKLWEENVVKKIDFESKVPLLVLKGFFE